MDMNTTLRDAFAFRHACKVFDPNHRIGETEFGTILEAARLSPSSFGQEPWSFLVVQNPELREKLRTHTWGAQRSLPSASHFVIILARTGQDVRYDSDYITYHLNEVEQLNPEVVVKKRGILENFQKHEFRLFDSDRAILDWSAKQCYIPLGNMMTSAALLGIDSCPIEGFDPAPINAVLASDFGVDTDRFRVAAMVAFGYRVDSPPVKRRQSAERTIRWFE